MGNLTKKQNCFLIPSLHRNKRELGKSCLAAAMLFSMAIEAWALNGADYSENLPGGG